MPFKSKQQMRYMFSQHPDVAKRWADETPNIKSLPKRVKLGVRKLHNKLGAGAIMKKVN